MSIFWCSAEDKPPFSIEFKEGKWMCGDCNRELEEKIYRSCLSCREHCMSRGSGSENGCYKKKIVDRPHL